MAAEEVLFKSVFTLFSGFLIFLSIILNKIHKFLSLLDSYFVLFLFSGIIISGIGISMMVVWNFKNRKPYVDTKQKRYYFIQFFSIGILMILIGFTLIYYLMAFNKNLMIISLGISVLGILLLVIGLSYFAKEVVFIRKTPTHS